jgi:hypothetical protein
MSSSSAAHFSMGGHSNPARAEDVVNPRRSRRASCIPVTYRDLDLADEPKIFYFFEMRFSKANLRRLSGFGLLGLRLTLLPLFTFWLTYLVACGIGIPAWPLVERLTQYSVFESGWFWRYGWFDLLLLVLLHLVVTVLSSPRLKWSLWKKGGGILAVSLLASLSLWCTSALPLQPLFIPGRQWLTAVRQIQTPIEIQRASLQSIGLGTARDEVIRRIGAPSSDGTDFSLFRLQDLEQHSGWNIRIYWSAERVAKPPTVEWYD